MAKIFTHRRINTTKGRIVIPDAPEPAKTPDEERAIMRSLKKEEQEAALAKRAKALADFEKLPAPAPSHTFFLEPELVMAFSDIPPQARKMEHRRVDQRDGPMPNKAILESLQWLRRFRRGEKFSCGDCGCDITASGKDRVPYEIKAEGPPYEISGLCEACWQKERDGAVSYISNSRIRCVEGKPNATH